MEPVLRIRPFFYLDPDPTFHNAQIRILKIFPPTPPNLVPDKNRLTLKKYFIYKIPYITGSFPFFSSFYLQHLAMQRTVLCIHTLGL